MVWRLDWDAYSWAYMERRAACHLVEREKNNISAICGVSTQWHDSPDRWRIAPTGMRLCKKCIWTVIRWERDNAEVVRGSNEQHSPFSESQAGRYAGDRVLGWGYPFEGPGDETAETGRHELDSDREAGPVEKFAIVLAHDLRLRNTGPDRFRGFGSDLRPLH